jgi:hypothetical protein
VKAMEYPFEKFPLSSCGYHRMKMWAETQAAVALSRLLLVHESRETTGVILRATGWRFEDAILDCAQGIDVLD